MLPALGILQGFLAHLKLWSNAGERSGGYTVVRWQTAKQRGASHRLVHSQA